MSEILKNILLYDKQEMSQRTTTPNGYLQSSALFAKSGIYEYKGSELGIIDEPDKIFKVFRPSKEVFNLESTQTFENLPVTLGHPPEMLTTVNTKQYATGYTGDHVDKQDEYVSGKLTITDEEAIRQVNGGLDQISLGYLCDCENKPGVTMAGESYDYIQRNIRGNHVALVPSGRAGENCRILDTAENLNTMIKKAQTKTKVTDETSLDNTSTTEIPEMVASEGSEKSKSIKPAMQDFEIHPAIQDAMEKGPLKDMLDVIMERLDGLETRYSKGPEMDEHESDYDTKDRHDEGEEDTYDRHDREHDEKDYHDREHDEKDTHDRKYEKKMEDRAYALADELVTVREAARKFAPNVDTRKKSPQLIKVAVLDAVFKTDTFNAKSEDYISGRFDALESQSSRHKSSYMNDQVDAAGKKREDRRRASEIAHEEKMEAWKRKAG